MLSKTRPRARVSADPKASAQPLDQPVKPTQVTRLVLMLIGFSMAVMALLAVGSLHRLDRQAREHMLERVAVALRVEHSRLADLAADYSFWDEAYARLIRTHDPAWADENIGVYLFDSFNVDLSAAVSAADGVAMAFIDGEAVAPDRLDLATPAVKALRQALDSGDPDRTAIEGLARIGGRDYLLALGAFRREIDGSRADAGSYLLLGKVLDATFFDELGRLYQLPELTLNGSSGQAGMQLAIEGAKPLEVSWQTPRPSLLLRRDLLLPGLLVTAVLVLLTWRTLSVHSAEQGRYTAYLESLATTDPLTGVRNRRDFLHSAEREIEVARRRHGSLSLLLLDIDWFKRVNDEYGHAAGDQMLIRVAQSMAADLRAFDILGRLGGEEFVVLLPDTTLHQALDVAHRLRHRVAEIRVPTLAHEIACTISVGLSEWRLADNVDSLMERADLALYEAKRRGRNRCEVLE